MKKKHIFLPSLVLPVVVFCSCSLLFSSRNVQSGSSSIIVSFPAAGARRNLTEEISCITVSIEPRVQNAVRIFPANGDTEAEFSEIDEGRYRILACALDANEKEIARGNSDMVDVRAGKTTTVSIIMRPVDLPIPEGFVMVTGIKITGTETWTPESSVFVSGRQLTIPDLIVCDHEVTRGEFTTVMGKDQTQEFMDDLTGYLTNVYDKNGNTVTGDALRNLPMSRVNWYHAMAYCNKLSLKEGLTPCYSVEGIDDWGYLKFTDIPGFSNASLTEEEQNLVAPWNAATCDFSANGYRLPTEAEWEWLARGGNDHTEYAGSDNIDEVAWYEPDEGDFGPHLVKLLKPNGYGLYDMTGNVYEMCWDKDAYPITSSTPATGAVSGDYRVVRGGSYYKSASQCSFNPYFEYSSDWNEEIDYVMCYDYGFRVVRNAR